MGQWVRRGRVGVSKCLYACVGVYQSPQVAGSAQLRVPTTRQAYTWWDPKYWSVSRPTDFCYGDCVWGLDNQPVPLSIIEWLCVLFRREELEYTLDDDPEEYKAEKVNRFRASWHVLHLAYSFWRVTETTKSTHTALKTPGTYGWARRLQQLTPEMIQQAIVAHQTAGKRVSLQSLFSNHDCPELLRVALSCMQQCTSGVIGSNGHRKLLQREGVAYTLRFGPPLVFVTPNLADTKQPLLLVVQGEEFYFGDKAEDLTPTYTEMVERLASDPVGQTLVFELMIRLFFVHVLGLRPECVGWRRGAARDGPGQRFFDGFAADFLGESALGPVAAAFGAVEAQGRGSLHPHILVWLIQLSLHEVLSRLMRDRAAFKNLIGQWMRAVIAAVVSVQESAVTELPHLLQGGGGDPLPPLPLGPKERVQYCADGERETASAERLGLDAACGDQPLWY